MRNKRLSQASTSTPWGFHPLPTRFTYLRPALNEPALSKAFGAWLAAEGRKA